MNRQILRTLAISNKWLDRCWNSEQHDRVYEMADGGFTVHEIAIAVWLCTGGWELREIERRMNNLISTCENVTKGDVRMGFTKESLWALRREVVLNSLFIADYHNNRHIDPRVVCDFFDSFLEDVEARMEEDIPGFNDVHFFDHLPKYDNPDTLWDYYCSIELDLSEYIPEKEEAA